MDEKDDFQLTFYEKEQYGMAREGGEGRYTSTIEGNTFYEKMQQISMPPEERFTFLLEDWIKKLEDRKLFKISEQDRYRMKEKIKVGKWLQYRNPLMFLLGYRLTFYKREEPLLFKLGKEYEISREDIVKYSRYFNS